jgi:transcriptional regulator with XRE-family HTH domain
VKRIALDDQRHSTEFRRVLQAALKAAQRRNPRFSLRALAARLGVDHSTLSQVMRGRRTIAPERAARWAARLGVSDAVMKTCVVERRVARPGGRIRVRSFDADTFALLAEWPHAAILELTHVPDFQADSRWLAARLGVPVGTVNIALQRLLRLQLLAMRSPTRWEDVSGDAIFRGVRLRPDARERIAGGVSDLARRAAGSRSGASWALTTMAIDASLEPRLRRLVDAFLNDVQDLARRGRKNTVYQLGLWAAPLVPATKVPVR